MSDQFIIEKNIPIPGRKTRTKYEFLSLMEVGDSVAIDKQMIIKGFAGTVTHYSRMNDKKFTIRTLEDGNARIWRIE